MESIIITLIADAVAEVSTLNLLAALTVIGAAAASPLYTFLASTLVIGVYIIHADVIAEIQTLSN